VAFTVTSYYPALTMTKSSIRHRSTRPPASAFALKQRVPTVIG